MMRVRAVRVRMISVCTCSTYFFANAQRRKVVSELRQSATGRIFSGGL